MRGHPEGQWHRDRLRLPARSFGWPACIKARSGQRAVAVRARETAEHPFSTIKAWMGATHFLGKGLKAVRTEMSLHVLAYNLRRMMATLGMSRLRRALAA
jgi:hypothetical protein